MAYHDQQSAALAKEDGIGVGTVYVLTTVLLLVVVDDEVVEVVDVRELELLLEVDVIVTC
jgi:hypothetical protein